MPLSEAKSRLARFVRDDACGPVIRARDSIVRNLASNRHDSATAGAWELVRLGNEGHRGVAGALREVREAFLEALAGEHGRDAESEFASLLLSAFRKLEKPQDPPCRCLVVVSGLIVTNRIDWQRAFNEAPTEPEWIAEPILECGRQTALYSNPKAGKSILTLDIGQAVARGASVLGNPPREPRVFVYIDFENTEDEVIGHLRKMGLDGTELENFHYWSFPRMEHHLDTPAGGQALVDDLLRVRAAVVAIDTSQRTLKGEENSNDTYNNFYQYTGLLLKAEGIALLRLEHPGKDISKGMRGGSAKMTDVDYVWRMWADPEDPRNPRAARRLELDRTHTRSQQGANRLVLMRTDDPYLHHEVVTGGEPSSDKSLVERIHDVALTWMSARAIAEELQGGTATTAEVKAVRQGIDNNPKRFGRRDTDPITYRSV